MKACRTCGQPLRAQDRARGLCPVCQPGVALRIAWLPSNEVWCVRLAGREHAHIVPIEGRNAWPDKAELLAALKRAGFSVYVNLELRKVDYGED